MCSGCKKIEKCKLPKYFYIAAHAQADYENAKREWRTGPRKTSTEMKQISEVLREGIKRKQSVDAIIQANSLPIATSTAYRYIANHNISGISNIDLKRQVRYSPRGSSKPQFVPMDYDYLDGRRYEDFLLRLETAESDENIWEMDTIIGKRERGEHCVLSLLHRRSNLQLSFLLPRKEMLAVNRVYDSIKAFLGPDLFKDAFSIILTDNGPEFHDPQSLETWAVDGRKLINIYYARPRRSDDKGKCEKNHEHFREKVPKGFSMNQLTQKDINFISNQVNNYVRKKLNYHSPYEIARMVLNEKVLDLNRLHFINPNLVDLTPILR
ncbi:MAG: IS30 family transposase [Erysipelotrichaceae bacterium]|nr:IS30 family transposase [Erysipelotrichaceae bacterium]MCH4045829.1 IS30 family transposase [Erysipelotrichaceae bacterium]MCH4123037.1 IS30 family transposase [Erysipelotrichaceae bacterium]